MDKTNSVGEFKYAGFWRRFVGWVIDFLIIIILAHWVSFLYAPFTKSQMLSIAAGSSILTPQFFTLALLIFLIEFIIIAVYYCLLEASPLQATIGKYIVGIEITDEKGLRVTYSKAFLRRIYSLLSLIPFFIGYIFAGFTTKKQTWHDALSKTIVVVKHKKTVSVLMGIFIIIVILGILSDMYLGAGFHLSFVSPTSSYDTQNGLQNYIVQNGNQVDPTTKNAVIAAYNSGSALYASGNLVAIRQHILMDLPPDSQQQITSMSDSDLKNFVSIIDKLTALTTNDLLISPDTTWTFSQDKTTVELTFKTQSTDGVATVHLNFHYNNGQWYF